MNSQPTANKLTNGQKGALADAFGKSLQTIERWERQQDDRLTSDRAKKALAEYEVKAGQSANVA